MKIRQDKKWGYGDIDQLVWVASWDIVFWIFIVYPIK